MNKTVWYISKYANTKKFGAETRQSAFCKVFADKGFDVKLITSNSSHLYASLPKFNGRYFDEESENFDVTWINTPQYHKATSIKRMLSWFWFEFFVMTLMFRKKSQKPDVVIASSLSILSVLSGSFYKLFFKSKFIFEVRDIWPQTLIDLKGMSKNHPLILFLSFIEKLGYKYADEVVGTMPGLSAHVKNVIGRSSNVHFIPQGVSLDFYQKEQERVSVEYIEQYLPEDKFIVTYAGTMGVANALSYIIEAAKILDTKNNNIHFLFVGSGREEGVLKQQAKGLSNVTFAPKVSKAQVQSVLSLSDVLVASVKNETVYQFGISLNKFIDYMYAKRPVICMFSGFPSMINEANCGEFITSEDPESLATTLLKYELMEKVDLDKLGDNGHKFLVEKRSFDVLSDQYIGLF
jgi:glycosyltransferase involved in cell wall biosynthesis